MTTLPSQASVSAEKTITSMFDRIAPRYDLANRILSLGQDLLWRKLLSKQLVTSDKSDILDLATGTADVAIELAKSCPQVKAVFGVDPSEEMLAIGRQKIQKHGLDKKITLSCGSALALAFPDNRFDAITIAFGIRNVTDVPKALKEMHRVCKPGGQILILEFSLPDNKIAKQIYLFYFRHILPVFAGLITGNLEPYRYLNRTVEAFPYGEQFLTLLRNAGFDEPHSRPLTFGIASLYQARKKNTP